MPVFSVIVPVYKVEKYIDRCVKSLMDQTFSDIEIILVDDGSPDNCGKMCDEYASKDARVKVIHKENGGVTLARRSGTEASSGEYISYVDGDDWVDERYFEKFYDIVKKHNPDIVFCGAVWAYEDRFVEEKFNCSSGHYCRQDIEEKVFPILIETCEDRSFRASMWGAVLKREKYSDSYWNVDSEIKIGEDQAFIKPCVFSAESMYVMDDCLYFYRQNPTSVTKNKKCRNFEEPLLISKHIEGRINIDMADFKKQLYRYTVHNLFNVAYTQFNQKKPYREIVREIRKQLKRPYYAEAIAKAEFRFGTKGYFALWAIRLRCYPLLFLYCKLGK